MSDPESPPQTYDSPTLTTSQTSSTSHIPAESSSSPIYSRYSILQVEWVDWGPPISRWFQVKGTNAWLINQSIGQRYVFLDPNPRDKRKCIVGVADFNLHNVRRNAEMMAQIREGDCGGNENNWEENNEENEEELEILDHEGEFSEDVYMGLKCVVYHAPGEYDFDAVLMDEERVLGLKVSTRKWH